MINIKRAGYKRTWHYSGTVQTQISACRRRCSPGQGRVVSNISTLLVDLVSGADAGLLGLLGWCLLGYSPMDASHGFG